SRTLRDGRESPWGGRGARGQGTRKGRKERLLRRGSGMWVRGAARPWPTRPPKTGESRAMAQAESSATHSACPSIKDLVVYYLRLGALGFGGPVALCGQMERELVQDRRWLTKEEMRDGIAVCQSLPGPLAIQVGIYVSYLCGGFWGAWAGGCAFILPNFVIVCAVAALYVYLSGLPILTAIFY